MTEKFLKAVELVLDNEGGYVNDPADPGGETKFGISKRSYPGLDIAGITKDQAKEIYYRDFWNPLKAESINNDRLAAHYFDQAVNSGKSRAVKMLEKVTGKNETGSITTDTISAVNNSMRKLPDLFVQERKKFYTALSESKPEMKKFLKGWFNRVDHIEKKNSE
jgi:lysozyme family protein